MENSKTIPKKYTKHLTLKNTFNGTVNLSDRMTKSSESLLSIMLRQTNLKSKNSVNEYISEHIDDAIENLHNSYYNPKSFDSNFGFDLFENYLMSIKNNFLLGQYEPILSNQRQVSYLLDGLTEVFYPKECTINGLEHIWIIFLENIKDYIDKLDREQKDTYFLSKTHINSVLYRTNPNNWGWFEFHIKSFADSFIHTLTECLNLKSKLIAKSEDLDNIYKFSKAVLHRIKVADKGQKNSKGFSTLGEFINPNTDKLSEAINFYKGYKFRVQDVKPDIEEAFKNEDIPENFSKNPKVFENEENIRKDISPADEIQIESLIPIDFIDVFVGKSRSENESIFSNIIQSLPKGLITLRNEKYYWNGYFINPHLSKNKLGMHIYAFFQMCRESDLIDFNKLPTTEQKRNALIVKLIIETFNIPNDIQISPVRFSYHSLNLLKRESQEYFTPFEKIPKFSKKLFNDN